MPCRPWLVAVSGCVSVLKWVQEATLSMLEDDNVRSYIFVGLLPLSYKFYKYKN